MSSLSRHAASRILLVRGTPRVLPRVARSVCTAMVSRPTVQQQPCVRSSPGVIKRFGAAWTSDSILDHIMFVLKTYDKIDASKLHIDADFVKDLGLDSLDMVEVTFHLEQHLITWISDEERETIETVRDVWEICMHKLLYNKA